MFDRHAHLRALSADPAIRARRNAAKRIIWTADMDAALIEMANARQGAIPIAKRIGVSKGLVRERRLQLGLAKGRPPGPARKVKQAAGTVIVKLLQTGKPT